MTSQRKWLRIKVMNRASALRACPHTKEYGYLTQATRHVWTRYVDKDGNIDISRCEECMYSGLGFIPGMGRVMRTENHACELCGQKRKSLKFMSEAPYPGQRKTVCVECFEGFGQQGVLLNVQR